MNADAKAINRIVARFTAEWQAEAHEAVGRLYELLYSGMKVDRALVVLEKEFPALFNLSGLRDSLVEAAAYGYGVMPSVLTSAEKLAVARAIEKPWSADGMRLSEKLHSTNEVIHKNIRDTVQTQINKNATALQTARELYQGYEHGQVMNRQSLPKYLDKILRAQGTRENNKDIRRAADNIAKLAQNGAPTKAMKVAYTKLLKAVEAGNSKAIERAARVAIEEKSRYVAERIARTEMARAYADGFFSRYANDKDVVGYRFDLGTRHPVFDVCDMYAKADMYNLGKGIYPKDKVPLVPIHPHCLCTYGVIYRGQVDLDKMRDQRKEAAAKWAEGLTERQAVAAFGQKGLQELRASKRLTGESKSQMGNNPSGGQEKLAKSAYVSSVKDIGKPKPREILLESDKNDLQRRLDNVTMSNEELARKKSNADPFSRLEVPMQLKSVKQVARKYDIDLSNIRIRIDRDIEKLGTGLCGRADKKEIGLIELYADAFTNEVELATTLLHERTHYLQLLKYGVTYCDEHYIAMEKAAYRAQDLLFLFVKRRLSKR